MKIISLTAENVKRLKAVEITPDGNVVTIPGVPEFLTREQYLAPLRAIGFEPERLVEIRYAPDGIHALVTATLPDSLAAYVDPCRNATYKHRVFIPVREEPDDERTTRVTPVKN